MCGITGIFNLGARDKGQGAGVSDSVINRELLKIMTDTLAHRGPDDSGFHVEADFGLGFRRLSIIDLESGNQPIYNEDKSIIVVCNGEIFNYRSLREMLQSKGHQFYTQCDVEVLVHLYEEYGTDFLTRLNGQFAFAIVDKKNRRFFLARDHAGIIPLFYTVADNLFIFASEIKAILKHPLVKREIDLISLDQIFSFPAVISPRTIFKGIKSIEPGHSLLIKMAGSSLRLEPAKIENKEYWDLIYPDASEIEAEKPESYYLERLDDLLQQSVRYRLIADVPVGFYLSGGIDSSLIAALIHHLYPGENRHSFSVGFTEKDIDERKYQQMMTEQVHSIHHETVFDWLDISSRLKKLIYHAETPLKESYDTCLIELSRLARENNIKVVLTGEGSDELFAGYIGYRFDQLRQDESSASFDADDILQREMEREIRTHLWGDPELRYERDQYELKETKLAIYSKNLAERFSEFDSVKKGLADKSKLNGRHPLHKRSYLDFKLRLPDHLLSDHGDRVAFANSVEARFPFLDINLIEFVKTIPPSFLVKESVEKYILKKYAEKFVPEQIIRREKFAFVAPGSPYLIRQNIEWINDLLSYERIKKQGYFNPDTIERLKKMYKSDRFMLNQNLENDWLMIVITFGIFLEIFDMP